MKLLFITEYFPSTIQVNVQGGVESRTYYLLQDLAKRHTITVLTSWEHDKPRHQYINGVEVWRIGPRRSYTASAGDFFHRLFFTLDAIRYGLKVNFDLVEGTGYMGWIPAKAISYIKGKKGVLWVPDLVESYTGENSFLINMVLKWFQRLVLMGNIRLVCISNVVKKKLLSYGISAQRIEVIYCGIDTHFIEKLKVKKPTFPTISIVSRLVAYKRIDELLHASANLVKEFTHLRLEIVGLGEELPKLNKLIVNLGLAGNIHIRGFVPKHRDVLRLLKRSWIYCQPSVIEGFGIAMVEALAAGIPVVVSDIPVHREITQNKGAMFYQPGSITQLTRQLKRMLTDKLLYKKFSRQAKEVAKKYNISRMVHNTEKIYADLYNH